MLELLLTVCHSLLLPVADGNIKYQVSEEGRLRVVSDLCLLFDFGKDGSSLFSIGLDHLFLSLLVHLINLPG